LLRKALTVLPWHCGRRFGEKTIQTGLAFQKSFIRGKGKCERFFLYASMRGCKPDPFAGEELWWFAAGAANNQPCNTSALPAN
jgi:hypothetical protein